MKVDELLGKTLIKEHSKIDCLKQAVAEICDNETAEKIRTRFIELVKIDEESIDRQWDETPQEFLEAIGQ